MASIISLRKIPVTGPVAAGPGGGTTFTYDAALQAGKTTVGGQEVLAPLRSGNGFRGRVVPDSNTLANLLAARQPAGVIAYPTDAPGLVLYNGTTVGDIPTYNTFGASLVIDLTNSSLVYFDENFGGLAIRLPRGVRHITLRAPGGVPAGFSGFIVVVKDSVEPLAEYTVWFNMDVASEKQNGRLNALGTSDVAQFNGGVFSIADPMNASSTLDYFRFMMDGATGITSLIQATQMSTLV